MAAPTQLADVVAALQNNVLLVPAQAFVRDVPQLAQVLGEQVLRMLNTPKMLLAKYDPELLDNSFDPDLQQRLTVLAALTPTLYLSVRSMDVPATVVTKDSVRHTHSNHMWLNAFSCISPSPQLAIDVGNSMIGWAKDNNHCAFVRINKS